MKKMARYEWLAIYVVAAMLVLSVGSLAQKASAAYTEQTDRYPGLYAPACEEETNNPDKTIYFTFDDGPSVNTEKILDILKEEDIKATFFVTMQEEDVDYAVSLLKRIVDEGHMLGLHSYTHNFNEIYANADTYYSDINKLNNFIIEKTGFQPSIIRFPGGSRTVNCSRTTMNAIKKEVMRRGYVYFDWDVVSGDDTGAVYPCEYLAERIVKGTKYPKSAVILAHDNIGPKTTPQALKEAIAIFRAKGYEFAALTPGITPVHIQ